MRYLSICSGIEAASVAWHPLGWRPLAFSEIEAFPRAVLKHHYPDVPLHGDFTQLRDQPIIVDADLLVGGTPCQAFSIAGLRQSLSDDRGNLSLEFIRLADAIDDLRRDAGREPAYVLWENVPGVFSTGDNAFGAFLGGLVGSDAPIVPRGRWQDAGVVAGPERVAAWRVLDAQYFGLAQRRKRVFVLARKHPRGWACADALLPIIDSLSGHPAPRRKAGKDVAPTLSSRPSGGGGLGTDFDLDGGLIAQIELQNQGSGGNVGWADAADPTFTISTAGPPCAIAYSIMPQNSGKDYKAREVDVAQPLMAAGPVGGDQGGDQGGDFIVQPVAFDARQQNVLQYGVMAGPLDTDGYSQAVAFAVRGREGGAQAEAHDHVSALRAASGGSSRDYVATFSETMYGVSHADASKTGPDQALRELRNAVGEKAYSKWVAGIATAFWPTEVLRPEMHGNGVRRSPDDWHKLGDNTLSRSPGNAAGAVLTLWEAGCVGRPPRGWQPSEQLARELVAHLSGLPQQRASQARFLLGLWRASEGLGVLREALSALQEIWRPAPVQAKPAQPASAVRRLTPGEAERLQGFPAGYTAIPWRGKPAEECPDGPRYKALGNSMATPCMAYIASRIIAVEASSTEAAA